MVKKLTNNAGLLLSLSIDRDRFVRYESIKAHVSLINKGLKNIVIEDLTPTNNPLFFIASNSIGGRFKASLHSFWMRDDENMKLSPPVVEKSLTVLKPGQFKEVDVDLINIFNDLPEGDYIVYASYRLCTLSFLRSNNVSFRIVKAKPIYSKTFQDYARSSTVPIRTSWINDGDDGFYVFLMDCSCNLPSNIIFNHRLLKIDCLRDVVPSILSTYGQSVEHTLWVGVDALYLAEILDGSLKNIRRISKSIGSPLLPPITAEDGELRLLTFLREESESTVYFVRLPFGEDLRIDEVLRFRELLGRYSIVFDMDCNPHFAYSLNGKIYYLNVKVYDQFSVEGVVNVLANVNYPIIDLHLSNIWMNGKYCVVLNYVVQENNRLCSYLVDVENRKHISHLYIPIENMDLKLLQVILDYSCNPYFLFQDSSGALWFKPYSNGFIKVTGEDEKCPGNVGYPTMLISSKYSFNYGVYLRYIKNKSIFTYRKLREIESSERGDL